MLCFRTSRFKNAVKPEAHQVVHDEPSNHASETRGNTSWAQKRAQELHVYEVLRACHDVSRAQLTTNMLI